ncbi:MAG TPA: PEPxxWA-CTERM sorting domain-containing protein [Arenimonas sp.]|nr:PEPxxWA-CTERM sorting domain-containing protein [Arenimonas sp.]
MKTKYIWVVTACAVLSGSHASSFSAVHETTLEPDTGLHSLAMTDALEDIGAIDSNQIDSISMMEIEVLNSVPEPLPSVAVSNASLLAGSEMKTFGAATQTRVTETVPDAQNPLLGLASELAPSVPEPETWAMLLAGLGLIGLQLRRGQGGRMDIH